MTTAPKAISPLPDDAAPAGNVEADTARPSWAEPFSAMYLRIRVQSYLIVIAFFGVLLQGYWLYALGTRAAAHVYEVHPDGKVSYVGDRETNLTPRAAEVRFVAKQFAELLYGWNSSTVATDMASAIDMCSPAMAERFRREIADVRYIETIRGRGIRSELRITELTVIEHELRHARVRVAGDVNLFPLGQYEGRPADARRFDIIVVLSVVPRDPDRRLSGLEVERIIEHKDAGRPTTGDGLTDR